MRPSRFGSLLVGHEAQTARSVGLEGLTNGELLSAAAGAGFGALITVDRSLRHQQDRRSLPLPVLLRRPLRNTISFLAPMAPEVLRLLSQRLAPRVYLIERDRP